MNVQGKRHLRPPADSSAAATRSYAAGGMLGVCVAGLVALAAVHGAPAGPVPGDDASAASAPVAVPDAPVVVDPHEVPPASGASGAVDAPAGPATPSATDATPPAPDAATALRPPLPKESIRYLAVDPAGAVWFRFVPAAPDAPAVAVLDRGGRRTDYADLRAAIAARFTEIRAGPSLADFWAVDPAGRVWAGPAFFDGRGWTEVAPAGGAPGAEMAFDARVVVDPAGTAWVPYHIDGECAASSACQQFGLMGFTAGGAGTSFAVDAPPEMAAHGLDVVQLAPGVADAVGAPRAMYRLPGPVPVYHAPSAAPGEVATGFATAFTAAPGGLPEFYLSVERVPAGAVNVEHGVVAARWADGQWRQTDLTGSPLFEDERGQVAIVVAAAYGPAGELWLAASNGNMALHAGGRWLHFNSRNSPLGAPIRAIAVGPDRMLWVGTVDGTRTYLDGVWASSGDVAFPRLHVPVLLKHSGLR